jgi:apolipoprotein N-acyltransferase
VGLVPFLAALDGARSARGALALGVGYGVLFTLGVFAWFGRGIAVYADAPAVVGLVALALAAPLLQPQLPLFALARHLAGGPAPWGVATGIAVWLGAEWALPKLFGDTLGHGLAPSPWLRQGADLAGAPGLTLMLLVANELVLAALRRLRAGAGRAALAPLVAAALLVATSSGYGALRLRGLEAALAAAPQVRVAAVQADIARYGRLRASVGSYDAVATILDAHFALSEEALAAGGVELLLWPETVYPTTFGAPKSPEGAEFDRAIAGLVARTGVPLVLGAYDAEATAEFNAAFFLERDGAGGIAFDTYRKAALFPLTERVPRWLEPLRRWLPWLGTWRPGEGGRVMPVTLPGGRTVETAPLICYDAVDPALARAAVRRGAELLVTLSNDSWFPGGAHLHLAVSLFRSLETRRAQARVTNTGVTALISPTGEILAGAGLHERRAVVGALPLVRGTGSVALTLGDWLGPTALVAAAGLLAASRLRRGTQGRSTDCPRGSGL